MSAAGTVIGEIGVTMAPGFLLTPPLPKDLTARILDPTQRRAPTALTVVGSGGYGSDLITFRYDGGGTVYYSAIADASGSLTATSVPVPPDMAAGAHSLNVTFAAPDDPTQTITADLSFTLTNNPATGHVVGPDADPVYVGEALQDDGHVHWVFQDLMPGGLGSYVFAHNPVTSSRPDFERALTPRRSTANNGQVHVSEGAGVMYQWTLTGFCFSQAEQEALESWRDLNRRFYVIDDFGEAWVAASTDVQIKPRKRSNLQVRGEAAVLTDWLAEYTFVMNVYTVDPMTPVGAP